MKNQKKTLVLYHTWAHTHVPIFVRFELESALDLGDSSTKSYYSSEDFIIVAQRPVGYSLADPGSQQESANNHNWQIGQVG